jgi:serine/threonine protein kinase
MGCDDPRPPAERGITESRRRSRGEPAEFEVTLLDSNDQSSSSRRIEPVTIRSIVTIDEPSLSSLERSEVRGPSTVSSSRERVVSLDRWLTNVLVSTDSGRARSGDETETLPSVRLPLLFADGTLVANRYEIRRRIGRGGMGQVYEAYDLILREPVALKTTTSQRSKGPERLLDEVRMARRITHPNVCRLYDAGVHEAREPQRRSTYFISMEYLEGHTLRHRLRHGLPSLPQVFGIARQLLIGLAAIHGAGVLHRDFKSENVMLRLPGNGTGQAVIMDFGLAQLLEDAASLGPTTGIGAGSHGYMAPEQIDNLPLGPETDLFAFGVVMYEMLTGRLPFARDGLKATTSNLPDQVPTPPTQIRADLPPELDAFVLKCLSACPSHRYRTAERALAALARIFETSSPRVRGSAWALGHGFPRRGARFRRSPRLRAAGA